jgi:hypothetical protein
VFVGHLAVALGAKRVIPTVPLGATVAAAFGLDLLWPILLLLGAESVRVSPRDTAFTNLAFDSYPWSHSLLLASGWSVLAGLVGRRLYGSSRAGVALGALVLSHWMLDFLTHRPDLPIWPAGPVAGLGLWNSIPATIAVEGALLAGGVWLYTRTSAARTAIGRWALVGLVMVTGAMWVSQPWSPPPPNSAAVAWGSLIMWLLVPWAGWIDRHRTTRAV